MVAYTAKLEIKKATVAPFRSCHSAVVDISVEKQDQVNLKLKHIGM